MVAAAILSFLISDLPCTALFTGIAVSSILKVQGCACGSSNLGKALMIGITYASVVGGQAIPSGSAMNVMAMNVLTAQHRHLHLVSGLDVHLLAHRVGADRVLLDIGRAGVQARAHRRGNAGVHRAARPRGGPAGGAGLEGASPSSRSRSSLWVASNWTGWDITAIAILCLALFFVPGIDVLTWKEYVSSVSWNIVLLIGCVQSIAGGVKEQGAASWLFGSTVGNAWPCPATWWWRLPPGSCRSCASVMPRGSRVHRHLPHPVGGHGRGPGREPRGVCRDRGA